jgi:hypothetical protein
VRKGGSSVQQIMILTFCEGRTLVVKHVVSCVISKVKKSLKCSMLPRTTLFLQYCSKCKVMLEVIFDWKGIVCHEFTPEGDMVN